MSSWRYAHTTLTSTMWYTPLVLIRRCTVCKTAQSESSDGFPHTHPAVLRGWAAQKTWPGSSRSSRSPQCSLSARSTGTTCGCHPPGRCWWDTSAPSGAGTVLLPLGTKVREGRGQEARVRAWKDAGLAFTRISDTNEQVGHQASRSSIGMERMMKGWKQKKC